MQQWWPSAASYCSWSLRSLCLFDWRCGCRDHTRERERERSGEERSGKRHLYLSLISSFRLTQMFISSNSCSLSLSLSLSLSFHLSRQATNPTTRSVLPPSVCTVHFSDPSVTSLLLARSPRLSLSLSLSLHTHSNVSQELDGRHPRREEQR